MAGVKRLNASSLVLGPLLGCGVVVVEKSQRELARKGRIFITFCFYVLSLEYPQAFSSST